MRVVTFATDARGYYAQFQDSAARHGVRVHVLGWGRPWRGFGARMRAVAHSLDSLDPDEVVLFVDAYDVVFLRPLDDLEAEYRASDHAGKVVVSTEEHGMLGQLMQDAAFGTCDGRSINAGVYVGTARAVRAALRLACAADECSDRDADDQRLLTRLCDARRDLFAFDRLRWFLTWPARDSDRVERDVRFGDDGQLEFRGARPFVLHCPGNKDMGPVLRRLGYDVGAGQNRPAAAYYGAIVRNHARNLLAKYWLCVLCACAAAAWLVRARARR